MVQTDLDYCLFFFFLINLTFFSAETTRVIMYTFYTHKRTCDREQNTHMR